LGGWTGLVWTLLLLSWYVGSKGTYGDSLMDWKKTDLEEKAFAMIMAFFIVIMAGVLIVSYPIARLIIKHDIL
jgi:hypothetical protein